MNKFQKIPIDKITIRSRFRKDLGNLQLLAKSISSYSLLNPITVRREKDGVFTLLAGFRRLKAHELLELDKIVAHIINEEEN